MQQKAHEKMMLIHDLRQAIIRNELQVYYQPILELSSGRTIKAEALMRWKHPRRGMISPTIFIPLAEESGLILEIGEIVFKQSIALIDQWKKRLGYKIQISVNMSPIQFKFMNKFNWLENLTQLGLPGSCINVEITEGLLLKDSSVVQEYLLEFRNHGIEVSIDDFGTGFSSLSYLKKFDIDYLKIDHSFISQLIESETDRTLVEAIIVMAHKLDIKTIAEGVETKEQQDLLLRFGCDYVQGFLYSEPIKEKAFEKLLFEQLNKTPD
jgi:EAL domain-containing protein (putative c-di-GMP-specific phosphodiesterase class I)